MTTIQTTSHHDDDREQEKEHYTRPGQLHKWITFAVLALTLVLASRAALTIPHPQSIPVTSTPEGAQVFVDGNLVGMAPLISKSTGAPTTSCSFVSMDTSTESRSKAASAARTLSWASFPASHSQEARSSPGACAADAGPGGVVRVVVMGRPLVASIASAAILATVDASTGQWLRLSPSQIHVTFD